MLPLVEPDHGYITDTVTVIPSTGEPFAAEQDTSGPIGPIGPVNPKGGSSGGKATGEPIFIGGNGKDTGDPIPIGGGGKGDGGFGYGSGYGERWYFVMPDCDVVVTATFREDDSD